MKLDSVPGASGPDFRYSPQFSGCGRNLRFLKIGRPGKYVSVETSACFGVHTSWPSAVVEHVVSLIIWISGVKPEYRAETTIPNSHVLPISIINGVPSLASIRMASIIPSYKLLIYLRHE